MPSRCRVYSLAALLACGMLLLPLPFLKEASAQTPEWIDAEALQQHVEKLARTPRPPATESEFAAAVYVASQLRSYGYQAVLQPFTYYTYRQPSTLSLSVEGWTGAKWEARGFTYGPNGVGTGEIVACGLGTAQDLQDGRARGKIALVQQGGTTFAEKVRQAAAAGAAAVIISYDRETKEQASLGEPLDMAVPVISVPKEQGRRLQAMLEKGPVKATVKVDGGLSIRQTSYNIVATKKADTQGTGQTILVTAHHDSAARSPGANNGASGVAVLLEVARMLAERPTDTEVRFVSFGAASAGEKGPAAYVASIPHAERKNIIAAFCLDAVGSDDAGTLTVTSASGAKNLPVTLAEAGGAVFSTAWNDRAELSGDYLPLEAAGIPAAWLTRAPADTWRDQPEDTMEKISKERLKEAAKVVFAAVSRIADPASGAYPETIVDRRGGNPLAAGAAQ
ncbi:M28 family peptidase [Brevibacillus sp. GCM10020057]|uniref:M28 family peptidase n=1 Tax=Brevibacillus sp. GCM10020057 TaxID=3317327 RepID=UPI0036399301